MEIIIDVKGLSFAYNTDLILKDVSFQLYQGDRAVLLGPNGGGKTTLIKLLLGIEDGFRGTIKVFNQNPGGAPNLIGYVPQHHQIKPIFPIRVSDVILMGATKKQIKNKKELIHQLDYVLDILEIKDLRQYMFSELSGGQRQRVLVGRALMGNPKLLFLDEPTSNVDPNMTACFYKILAKLPKDITILVVSHDLSVLSHNINRVFGVNQTMNIQNSAKLTPEMLDHLYGMNCHHLSIKDETIVPTPCEPSL